MATLHGRGHVVARKQIDAGNINETASWSFSASDGDRLLGDDEDNPNWERFSNWHLGREAGADAETKAAWKFPFGKFDGDKPKVFRSALRAIASRAAQTGDDDISEAASGLIQRIDERKDESSEAAALALPHLAARVFATPLMIHPGKLEAILAVLRPRIFHGEKIAAEHLGGTTPRPFRITADGVAVIPVLGTLVMMAGGAQAMSGLTSFGSIEAAFIEAIDDAAVRAVLLEIDSPGGEVNGVFDLADLIFAARGAKPIWAVANEQAFSAAFALASAADRIVLPRTATVGSVGVVAAHIDQSARDEAEGLDVSFVFAGDKKIDGNPHEPLSERARADLQDKVDAVHDIFIATVARGRGLTEAVVRGTEADIFMGRAAVLAGFADDVGTFNGALAALAETGRSGRTTFAGAATQRSHAQRRSAVSRDGNCPIHAGENLARLLDELIEKQVTDDRDRSDVIEEMADEAGISPGTVNQILNGTINCPPIERLEAFARVLDTTVDDLISAAEEDGCDYDSENDSQTESAASAPRGDAGATKAITERGNGAAPNTGEDKEDSMSDAKQSGAAPPAEQAGAAKTAKTKPGDGNVVDLDKVRAEAKAAAIKDVSQIVDLCVLAGLPAMAKGFIDDGLSEEEVRKRLLTARAEASNAADVTSRHEGGTHGDAANNYGWDRAFARATGRKLS